MGLFDNMDSETLTDFRMESFVDLIDRKILERLQRRYIIVDEGHRLGIFQSRLVQCVSHL